MTNEERAAQIIRESSYSVTAAANLKAAGLLTPDPEPRYRQSSANVILRGYVGLIGFTGSATPREKACVLTALNAMEDA